MSRWLRYLAGFGYVAGAGYLAYVAWHTPRCAKCSGPPESGDRE